MEEKPPVAEPPSPQVRGGGPGAAVTWATFGLLVGLWAVTLIGRSWRAPPGPFVVAVTFLPYQYALFGAWTFGVWTLLPDRRLPPAMLAAIVISAAVFWGPTLAHTADPTVGTSLRVATWNVRRLWGPADALGRPEERRRALSCVVDGVEQMKPDVLALLEVSAVDIGDLSARLDLSCIHGDYMGTDQEDLGGLAVCTRGDAWTIRSGERRQFVDDQDWFYTFAEVVHDDRVLNVFAVHLQPYAFGTTRIRKRLGQGDAQALIALSRHGDSVSRTQVDQSAALLDHMERMKDPAVVLGDFNSTRDTALHTALRRVLTDTWEAAGKGFGPTVRFLDLVPLRVDYAYASRPLGVVSAAVPPYDCSDHRPVLSELRLAPATPR